MQKIIHQPRPNLPGSGLFMQGWVREFRATLAEWAYINFLATSAINEVVDAIYMSRREDQSFGTYPSFLTKEQRYRLAEYDGCAYLIQSIRDAIGEEQDWRDDTVVRPSKYDCISISNTFREWLAFMHLACISADPQKRYQKENSAVDHKRREFLAIVEATEGCRNLMARIDYELTCNLATYRKCPQEYTALQPNKFWGDGVFYADGTFHDKLRAEHQAGIKEERASYNRQLALKKDEDKARGSR
jgi:hypothetical protein